VKLQRLWLLAAVGLLTASLALAATPAAGPVAPEDMQGLSFDGLTPEQKTLAVCRRDDSKCTRSLGLGKQVIDLVKAGKGRDEIVKSVLSPPSKYVDEALAKGATPSSPVPVAP